MGESGHDGLAVPGRVVLARELPFRLGKLQVLPAVRQVIAGDRRETLEPRVMQVLVLLARVNGDIVTRDELIHACWDGRIVSENAINRVISRVRKVAELCPGAFEIETIAKVGYRLKTDAAPDLGALVAWDATTAGSLARRPFLFGIGTAGGATALGAFAWLSSPRRHEPLPLAKLYYQRGIEARGQNSLTYGEQSVAYFRRATQIDPEYAEAWGALAWSYRALLEYSPRKDSANVTMLARSAAGRALELDPDNADAQAALLLLKPFYRNWAEIEDGCRKLLTRHPGHSITRFNLAAVLTETGRWRESIPHFQELAAREPFWPLARMQLFRALFNSGRLDEAEEQIQEALKLWPRRIDIWSSRLRQLLLTGRSSEALAFLEAEPVQPLDSRASIEMDRLIALAYVSGSESLRRRAVDRLLEEARADVRAVVWGAVDCSFLGEVDPAFSLLEGFFFARGPWAASHPDRLGTGFLFNSLTATLRQDARFMPLVEELGLESFWRTTGRAPDYRRFT